MSPLPRPAVPAGPSSSQPSTQLLVVGPERSGTTWVAKALCEGAGAAYVHEPDNPFAGPAARHAGTLGLFPVLEPPVLEQSPGDHQDDAAAGTADGAGPDVAAYDQLWQLAFSGHWPIHPLPDWVQKALGHVPLRLRVPLRRAGGHTLSAIRALQFAGGRLPGTGGTADAAPAAMAANAAPPVPTAADAAPAAVVVKSVYCLFALEWIVERHRPTAVVLVRRNPAAIAASLLELGTGPRRITQLRAVYQHPAVRRRFVVPLGLPELPEDLSVAQACAWWAACSVAVEDALVATRPGWILVEHEALAQDPAAGFGALLGRLGLERKDAVERFLAQSDRTGRGFSTRRVTRDTPERWRSSLGPHEAEVLAVVESFPRHGR